MSGFGQVLVGALWGMLTVPGAVFYPAGRLIRGLYATAAAESDFKPAAKGDAGASVGILQFNAVNLALVGRSDWRLSPFWSGVAAVRYLADRPAKQVLATVKTGPDGLAAWRSLWVTGDATTAQRTATVPTRAGERPLVGPIAEDAWEDAALAWLATPVQYVILIALVGTPIGAAFLVAQLIGLVFRAVTRV